MREFIIQLKKLTIYSAKLLIKYPWLAFLSTYGIIFRDLKHFNREIDKIELGYYDN